MYDVALVGGGLAGLAAAILLARAGWRVILFEQERYPFHKVCGEYLAEESLPLLERLGVPLAALNLPQIQRAVFSSPAGHVLDFPLQAGGVGISRYTLDALLVEQARLAGVVVQDGVAVRRVEGQPGAFVLQTAQAAVSARTVCGTWGKYSSLDVSLQREFTLPRYRPQGLIGVKYHVQLDFPRDQVVLHSFPGGYCGLSAIENERYCMAYLASTQALRACDGDVEALEQTVLAYNPHLRDLLSRRQVLYAKPLVIAQVHFRSKTAQTRGILMAGDSAGLIAPLSGNGMSMALRAAVVLAELLPVYLRGACQFAELEAQYTRAWQQLFQRRLRTGRWLQACLRQPWAADLLIHLLQPFPGLVATLHRQTHGDSF